MRVSGGRVRQICPYCGGWYDPDCPAALLASGGHNRPVSSLRPASSRIQSSGDKQHRESRVTVNLTAIEYFQFKLFSREHTVANDDGILYITEDNIS